MIFVVHEPLEADRSFPAHVVDGQITRHSIEPSREFVSAIVLTATLENANPCFLEEVLGEVTIPCEAYQIPEQPVLILLDELIQQLGIAPAKTASNGARLGLHTHHEVVQCGDHATGYTGKGAEKMHKVTTGKWEAKSL